MYIICYYQTFKIVFSQQGVPQIFVSDNGPQYSATLFKECVIFLQANGAAKRAVHT